MMFGCENNLTISINKMEILVKQIRYLKRILSCFVIFIGDTLNFFRSFLSTINIFEQGFGIFLI